MSDYTSSITSETTAEEITTWAEDEVDDMDIDTTDEIEEAVSDVEDCFEEEIQNEKELLSELKVTLSGNLSDEQKAEGKALEAELEALINNLEDAEDALVDQINNRSTEIYDGTTGGQVNVTYSDDMFSEEESDPLIINVNASANYYDTLGTEEEDESEYGADGIKNYEDLYTTNLEDLTLKQIIALDYSSLANAVTSVASYDENSGLLVLKTVLEDGSYRLTEIRGFDPDTMVLCLNGSFMNESNSSHWTDTAPDSITQSIYVNGSDYNLYDTLHVVGATQDKRLQYTGYADVTSEANISSTWSSYSPLITSGLTQEEFIQALDSVGNILYQMIDDPSLLADPTLYADAMAALSTSSLSAAEKADAVALMVLQMLKYDTTGASTLLAGDYLNQILTLLTTSVDASGHPTALATAVSMIADEKLAGGALGLSTGENLTAEYSTSTTDEDGTVTTTVDYAALLTTLNSIQTVYSTMGYGNNASVSELITSAEAGKTAAEAPPPGTSSDYDSAYDEFKNFYSEYKNEETIDVGVRQGEWKTFLSRLLNNLFTDDGNLVDNIWSAIESATSKEGNIEGEDKDDLLANFICAVNASMSEEFKDAIFSAIAKKCSQFFAEDSDGWLESEAEMQDSAEAILQKYL